MSIDAGVGILLGTALGSSMEAAGYHKRTTDSHLSGEYYILAGRVLTVLTLGAFPAGAAALVGTITKTHIAGLVALLIVNAFFSVNYLIDRDDEDAEKGDLLATGVSILTKMINISLGLYLISGGAKTTAVPAIALTIGPVALTALGLTTYTAVLPFIPKR